MVILPTIILFIQLAAGCRNKEPNVQCIDAAVGEGGSWPTVPFGEVLGWDFDFQNPTGSRAISIEPQGTNPIYVLGLFNRGSGETTTIKQDFACSYDSKVNVKYRLYSCGDLETPEGPGPDAPNSRDWSALNFNQQQLPSTLVEGVADDATALTPSTRFDEIVQAMSDGNGCEDEGQGNAMWSFTNKEINTDELPEVDADETFTIAFTSRISFNQEWMAIGNIRVICIAKDGDTDGVADTIDNCPKVYNPDQSNLDWDKKGDKCDYDIDGDWVPNTIDKCPTKPGSYYNYGCPEYERYGKGDQGKRQGGYRYDGGKRDDGRGGRGRYGYGSGSNSGSGSGLYSSSYSDSNSRGHRSRNRYGRDDKDERREIENLIRKLEYEYRAPSKY